MFIAGDCRAIVVTRRIAAGTGIVLALVALSLLLVSAAAAQAVVRTDTFIDSGWEFRQATASPVNGDNQWRPATVPGDVHLDLLHNKLIPEPFYGENEAKLQWIENADWEYRTTFQAKPDTLANEHIELVFDGLDAYADVYLNGQPLLTADNQFRQWRADVKPLLHPGANELRVVFPSVIRVAPQIAAKDPWYSKTGVEAKTYIRKAAYEYGWDWGPRFVTSGIWRPVHLVTWNAAKIRDFHVSQRDLTADVAHLVAGFEVESSKDANATVSVMYKTGTAKPVQAQQQVHLHPGKNLVEVPISIEHPSLWWPAGYGPQSLYEFTGRVMVGSKAEDETTQETGLRTVELRRDVDKWGRSFEIRVNGVPIFGKGADVIPFDSFASRVTTAQYKRILESARAANMNMIRHWGGGYYETDEFYKLCDELGIMVWQDFMFGNDWQPGDYAWKQNVEKEADYQLRRLRHHPSIVLWCGNNETEEAFHWRNRDRLDPETRIRMWTDYMSVASGILARTVAQLSPETPYWPSSPSSDYEDITDAYQSGDMHDWQVWHALAPLHDYEKVFPRFMTEFGFQSFPELRTVEAYTAPQDRTGITTPVMLAHQKNTGGNQRIYEYMLRDYLEPKDLPSFLYVSQVLQANAIKIGAEHLRRLRPRSMGSIYWQLNDCWPVASWASIDYFGRWKALQYYARRFYAPVLVSPHEENGNVAVYVVSDETQPVAAQLTLSLMTVDGKVLKELNQNIEIPPLSSKIYYSVPRETLIPAIGMDSASTYLVAKVVSNTKLLSQNVLYFDSPKLMHLPHADISTTLTQSASGYKLRLSSSVLARDVYITFGDLDTQLSDNYFDLLPNAPVEVEIKSVSQLADLQKNLKVISLSDAFDPAQKQVMSKR